MDCTKSCHPGYKSIQHDRYMITCTANTKSAESCDIISTNRCHHRKHIRLPEIISSDCILDYMNLTLKTIIIQTGSLPGHHCRITVKKY